MSRFFCLRRALKVWEGTKIKRHKKGNDDTGFIRRIVENVKSIVESSEKREGSKWD